MFVGEQRGKNIDFPLLKVRQVSIIIEPGQPFECSVQFIYIYIYVCDFGEYGMGRTRLCRCQFVAESLLWSASLRRRRWHPSFFTWVGLVH